MYRKVGCLLLASESNVRVREIWEETHKRLKGLVEIEVGSVCISDGEVQDHIVNK